MALDIDLDFGDFDEYEADFVNDGLGLSGQQFPQPDIDETPWNPQVRVDLNQDEGFVPPTVRCDPGTPPASGTHIFGSVGGTCQWIDTTTC